jgi:hypothetical protein
LPDCFFLSPRFTNLLRTRFPEFMSKVINYSPDIVPYTLLVSKFMVYTSAKLQHPSCSSSSYLTLTIWSYLPCLYTRIELRWLNTMRNVVVWVSGWVSCCGLFWGCCMYIVNCLRHSLCLKISKQPTLGWNANMLLPCTKHTASPWCSTRILCFFFQQSPSPTSYSWIALSKPQESNCFYELLKLNERTESW